MQRLRDGRRWSVFDPAGVPSLCDLVGSEFTAAYTDYENSGLAVRFYDINVLWSAIVDSQRQTGGPFLVFQDNVNRERLFLSSTTARLLAFIDVALGCNNEEHLGIVRSSNLCTEIVQVASLEHPAVCVLASISLPCCVDEDGGFNFNRLFGLVKTVVVNTDRCIDISEYPSPAVESAARRTRALGIGVQGLADVFMMLHLPFTCDGARALNVAIFETIYYASLDASCDLAEEHGSYPAWEGSPASRGILQIDMWGATPSVRHDFQVLRDRIRRHGLRNSVVTALMPTASTSKLMGNFESFEPYTRYAL